MASYIALSYWDLSAASVLVLVDAALSIIFGLRIHRSLLIAAVRMTVQLAFVGLVLTFLFAVVSPLWTGLAALGMILFAGVEVTQRQERRLSGWWSYGLGTGCMMISSVVVTIFALLTALQPTPWYDPRYAIPLLGMILGNCMTGIALGLYTLTTSLVSRRASVEAQLMLGATRWDAAAPVTREALRSALMPDDQFHVRNRPGVFAGNDDRADPGRSTSGRGGEVPDPGDVLDCGRYRVGRTNGRPWRRLPPDRRASSTASRSDSRCKGHLADGLQSSAERRWDAKNAPLNRLHVDGTIELLWLAAGRTGQQSAP